MNIFTTKSQKAQKKKNTLSHLCAFFAFVVISLFLISCSDPFNPSHHEINIPQEYGSFSLSIEGNAGRTIIPTAPALSDYAVYTLAFTATSGGANISVERTNATLAEPIILVAGTYDLTVNAYLDAGKTQLAAQGTFVNIAITAGANVSASVQLKALSESGAGTFNWSVSISASGVTSATMIISQGNTPLSGYPETLLNTGTSSGEASLPSGIYNVNFRLARENEEAEWNELLYIYSSLTSDYLKTFDDQYFYHTHYNVTFNHNYDGISVQQSVLHGGTLTAPVPIRDGYNFNGWYTDAAAVNAYNFSDPVYNNITLYAGWIGSSAVIMLDVAQIENGDPVFTTPIVVSRNGLGGSAAFIVSVSNAGNYSYFKWEIAGVGVMPSHVVEGASVSTFTINGSNPNYAALGGHVLKLTVTRNGVLYQVNIPFTVIETTAPVELTAHGVTTGYSDLTAAFTAIGTQAGNFIIRLRENQTITAGRTISTANQHITIVGEGAERTINGSTIAGATNMFTISNATASLTLGNNVTIRGRTVTGTGVVVSITNGTFTMQTGSKITGHTTSTTTGAAVHLLTNTTASFIMNGGSIEGNNNTTAAATTTASGGVAVTTGTFTMNGGSITGNTQGTAAQVTDGTAEASDVYHSVTTANSFTMSGDAAIGALKLNATSATVAAGVNIAEGWTGSITTLNLRGGIAAAATVSEWWDYKLIFSGINTAKINDIGLGDFISSGTDRQPISSSHFISASGYDIGRLMINPALATVTISENGGAAAGYSNLASAFTAIGTRIGNFTVTLLQNQTITAGYTFSTASQNITITGDSVMRTINGNTIGTGTTMFTISNVDTSFTLGNNITIIGRTAAGTGPIVHISNGKFVMQTGSKIREHTNSTVGAVVNINSGTSVFEMNGGSIENNTTANTTGAAVIIATTNASFIMNGGSITGNNNTTAASTTTASGGVALSIGTFTMTGGSITGNTQGTAAQVTEGTAAASDVYHAVTTANSFTISGNAAIGALKLNRTSATAGANVRIGAAGWNGSINLLNLRGNTAAAETVLTWWNNIFIFSNITSEETASITLGDFIGSGGATLSISPIFFIGASSADLGKLILNPGITGGSPSNPLLISNEADLRRVGTGQFFDGAVWGLNSHYRMTANINITGGNWERIGTSAANSFTGSLNGSRFTISGITINSTTSGQGLFGYIGEGGIVQNLGLINVNITGSTVVGGISGQLSGGTVENCFVSGSVTGTTNVGGITGGTTNSSTVGSTVARSYFDGNVTGTTRVGGIAGDNRFSTIANCYSSGTVTNNGNSSADNGTGGIAGFNLSNGTDPLLSHIINCYSTSRVLMRGTAAISANGIAPIFGHARVENSIALNQEITSVSGSPLLRIGSGGTAIVNGSSTTGTRANNRAWHLIDIRRNTAADGSGGEAITPVSSLTGQDGLTVTTDDLKLHSTWETASLFSFGTSDASPWVWENGKMPRLYWETNARDWPLYLTD